MTPDEERELIFGLIQNQLKDPPVIIWGSGASVPFGIPGMWHLNETLKKKVPDFDDSSNNLEIELGKDKYKTLMPTIKSVIWSEIANADEKVLSEIVSSYSAKYSGLEVLVNKFIDTHPKVLNIITTNYDRVIESVLGYAGIDFTDGFEGKNLSLFDESSFRAENIVNLIKVHGSLSWFQANGQIRFLNDNKWSFEPQIICPGKNKYQEAYESPYRELIQKSDQYIKNASSFLAIGFGFNDEHLTPRIRAKVKTGSPIVVITKSITSSCKHELKDAERYTLIEKEDDDKTKVTFKNSVKAVPKELIIEGSYWMLNNFNKII